MLILGIDTSNYATSLAVYDTKAEEVLCDIKKFLPVTKGQIGLRQSDALFHHTAALPVLLEQLGKKVDLTQVQAVGVSEKPRPTEGSYMPCFLAGVSAAQAFCLSKNIPLIKTTHQQGHIAAALYATKQKQLLEQKTLVFHISGGTTDLLLCENLQVLERVGTSTDLYAGQAVDRLGVRLGFDFPAGAFVSAKAAECTEKVKGIKVSVKGTNCSLSGLQNQCERLLQDGKSQQYVCKFCLLAVAKTILQMIEAAHQIYPNLPVVCAGGVMSSDVIRAKVQRKLPEVYFVDGKFSSDNAIGTAFIAGREVDLWQK